MGIDISMVLNNLLSSLSKALFRIKSYNVSYWSEVWYVYCHNSYLLQSSVVMWCRIAICVRWDVVKSSTQVFPDLREELYLLSDVDKTCHQWDFMLELWHSHGWSFHHKVSVATHDRYSPVLGIALSRQMFICILNSLWCKSGESSHQYKSNMQYHVLMMPIFFTSLSQQFSVEVPNSLPIYNLQTLYAMPVLEDALGDLICLCFEAEKNDLYTESKEIHYRDYSWEISVTLLQLRSSTKADTDLLFLFDQDWKTYPHFQWDWKIYLLHWNQKD